MTRYIVYTKSNCGYCDKVKELLKNVKPQPQIILCDEYLLNEKSKEHFLNDMTLKIGWQHRTFPMVFFNNKFIGGYEQTLRFYERSCIIDSNDTDF